MRIAPENTFENNYASIAGVISKPLQFSHKTYGESFYTFHIAVERKSGYEDEIIVMISERLMTDGCLYLGQYVKVVGQIRTYNENFDGKNKLNIVVFAREIEPDCICICDENNIYLSGFLCKKPLKRTSPLGRQICDIMLAVNRMYNKSDYIPCIAWGRNAIFAESLDTGDKITVEGRLQSREYRKKDDNGNILYKVAYEVSILKLIIDEN